MRSYVSAICVIILAANRVGHLFGLDTSLFGTVTPCFLYLPGMAAYPSSEPPSFVARFVPDPWSPANIGQRPKTS